VLVIRKCRFDLEGGKYLLLSQQRKKTEIDCEEKIVLIKKSMGWIFIRVS